MHIYPDYYPRFRCIASACRHNCCIGWEIDIDEDTLARYQDIGDRLCRHISREDTPHFVLQGERCPFLNSDNLCDIITEFGEGLLCDICREHPRFHNALPGRTESGLGLCCEAAGTLILGQADPVSLPAAATDDPILRLRDRVIAALQDRRGSVEERIEHMLALCETSAPDLSVSALGALFLSLERLEESWGERLKSLGAPTAAFAAHINGRESEYEQFCVYLIYRHFALAPTIREAAAVARLTALCHRLIYALGSARFEERGDFTFADQVELCRQFSAEVEYSDENLRQLLSVLG